MATYTKTVKRDSKGRQVRVYEVTGIPTQCGPRGTALDRLLAAVKALTLEIRKAKREGRL